MNLPRPSSSPWFASPQNHFEARLHAAIMASKPIHVNKLGRLFFAQPRGKRVAGAKKAAGTRAAKKFAAGLFQGKA